jgi:hypothetical protein
LQYEFTADYGMGIVRQGTIQPTKRYWITQQLANLTPPGARHMGVGTDTPAVHAAAFVDPAGECVIDLDNSAAERPVTITGLPANVTSLHYYITDAAHDGQRGADVIVSGGTASVDVAAMSFVTLTSVAEH